MFVVETSDLREKNAFCNTEEHRQLSMAVFNRSLPICSFQGID